MGQTIELKCGCFETPQQSYWFQTELTIDEPPLIACWTKSGLMPAGLIDSTDHPFLCDAYFEFVDRVGDKIVFTRYQHPAESALAWLPKQEYAFRKRCKQLRHPNQNSDGSILRRIVSTDH